MLFICIILYYKHTVLTFFFNYVEFFSQPKKSTFALLCHYFIFCYGAWIFGSTPNSWPAGMIWNICWYSLLSGPECTSIYILLFNLTQVYQKLLTLKKKKISLKVFIYVSNYHSPEITSFWLSFCWTIFLTFIHKITQYDIIILHNFYGRGNASEEKEIVNQFIALTISIFYFDLKHLLSFSYIY